MKKRFLGLMVCLLLISGVCAKSKKSVKSDLEKTKFTIGHLNSTAHLLAFVAQEEGFFKEEGLSATV